MLAQNFKTATDLGITEPQLSALQKTLVLLETGKLKHVPMGVVPTHEKAFSGQFNMNQWHAQNDCGTICCIGGTAQLIGSVSFDYFHKNNRNLNKLFYPDGVRSCQWQDITTAQAATALRSYLTTGDARWDLAVA